MDLSADSVAPYQPTNLEYIKIIQGVIDQSADSVASKQTFASYASFVGIHPNNFFSLFMSFDVPHETGQ